MPAPLGHPNYDTEGLAGRPKIYTTEFLDKLADELIKWVEEDEEHIYYEEFFLKRRLNPKKSYEWIKEHERFRDAYEIAHTYQLYRLKHGATKRVFSEGFSKFILINNHGLSDKTETKISGDAENPVAFALTEVSGNSEDLVANAQKIK